MKAKIRFGYFFISLVFLLTFGTLFHNSTGAAGPFNPVEQEATPNGDWAVFWAGKDYSFTWEAYYEWEEEGGTDSLLFTGSAYGCTGKDSVGIDSMELRALFAYDETNGIPYFLRETSNPAEWETPFETDITPVPTVYGITPVPTPEDSNISAPPADSSTAPAETESPEDMPLVPLVPPPGPIVTYTSTLRVGGSVNFPPPEEDDMIQCAGVCTYYHDFAVTFELNFETNKVTIKKVELMEEQIPAKISCTAGFVSGMYCHRWAQTTKIQDILEGKVAVSGDPVPIVVDLIPMDRSEMSGRCFRDE